MAIISSRCKRAPKNCTTDKVPEFHCEICRPIAGLTGDGVENPKYLCVFCGHFYDGDEDRGACDTCQLRSHEELYGNEWIVRTLRKQAQRITTLEKEIEALKNKLGGV